MRTLVTALALLAAVPAAASAQHADFLFGQPHGSFAVKAGWRVARAGSDVFTFVEQQFTVSRKDFDAPIIGFDVDFRVAPRLSAIAGVDFGSSSVRSEYRDFVDDQRLPIEQTTRLRETNLGAGIKFDLLARGREVSPHAWIPARVTPYVGAGAGAMHYTFTQEGDFVRVDDLAVLPDTLRSSGWSPSAHVFGGVDVRAWRSAYFNGEARYLWSHSSLSRDFVGFEPIDLAGFKMTGGIRFLF